MNRFKLYFKNSLAFLCIVIFLVPVNTFAQSNDDIQAKIDSGNNTIAQLEQEIKQYQGQLDSLGTQESSLKNALSDLDISQKQLQANLALTQDKINTTNLELQQLSQQISAKSDTIDDSKKVVSQSLRNIDQINSNNAVETIFGSGSLADALDGEENFIELQSKTVDLIGSLLNAKASLDSSKTQTEQKKTQLVSLQTDLTNQKKILAETVTQKNTLLSSTKNTEASYKKIVADKMAQEQQFEREVLDYESQLKLSVDASKLPPTGSAPLAFPLDDIKITQYFGNTPFATANPQIYSGQGHTGVDFGASIGTPVHAALDGIVVGVGNTDLVPGCYSFGKWIMIKHPDGLSSLYAHLSLQNVAEGDTVTTGQLIGYSGNTGYTTGPHLHFGVYATQGVVIKLFDTSIGCKGAVIPIADLKAYLNPLSYLPPVTKDEDYTGN